MGIYSADGLVQFTEEEMFNLPEGKMTVVFSDGSRIITTKEELYIHGSSGDYIESILDVKLNLDIT